MLDAVLVAPGSGVCVRPVRIRLPEGELPAVLVRFSGRRSYTGEDGAELSFAGGGAVRRAVLDQLMTRGQTLGLRPAEPGEFTARAFLNGKLTGEQAEGVAAVIASRSEGQLAAARRLMAGDTGREFRSLADEIAGALALVEAGIDFVDQEDVVAISAGELRSRLELAESKIKAILGSTAGSRVQEGEPVVVIAGAPNAGKSTLFNALLGRKRSVVSDVAGTTRDAVRERLKVPSGGWGLEHVVLVDLAGLDAALGARSAIDFEGQRQARLEIDGADVVVLCAPAGDPWPEGVAGPMARVIRVRTKADLLRGAAVDAGLAVCGLDGWNVDALRRAIADAATSGGAGDTAEVLPRHRAALTAATAGIRGALRRVRGHGALSEPEVIAMELREALDALGQIAGQISPDDVIGRIFATFCVGK